MSNCIRFLTISKGTIDELPCEHPDGYRQNPSKEQHLAAPADSWDSGLQKLDLMAEPRPELNRRVGQW